MKSVSYEWWVEFWDEFEDIVDCYSVERIDVISNNIANRNGLNKMYVCKRFYGDNDRCEVNRGHAYAGDKYFDSGHEIPERIMAVLNANCQ